MEFIKCENLAIGYENKTLLKDINFTISKGEYFCIIGENGVGKSTLIKTILGLTPPLKGKVALCNNFTFNEIGYIPQQTQIQKDFPASVWEVVLSGCINAHSFSPFYSKRDKIKAMSLLEKMKIEHLAKKSFNKISGGQQQRTLIARALCATDKMLLLDEPTSGLDISSTKEMYSIVKDLNSEGTAICMVTHDSENALNFSSHVVCISSSVDVLSKNEYFTKQRCEQCK